MWHYHELVPLHSRIFSPINKFYTALIFIYSFLISTGVSYIFFTTKSVTMTGHFFLLLPDLKWNQPIYLLLYILLFHYYIFYILYIYVNNDREGKIHRVI